MQHMSQPALGEHQGCYGLASVYLLQPFSATALQPEASEILPSDALQQGQDENKGKKPVAGARPRSIKTPLQREALEAAFLSTFVHGAEQCELFSRATVFFLNKHLLLCSVSVMPRSQPIPCRGSQKSAW